MKNKDEKESIVGRKHDGTEITKKYNYAPLSQPLTH